MVEPWSLIPSPFQQQVQYWQEQQAEHQQAEQQQAERQEESQMVAVPASVALSES